MARPKKVVEAGSPVVGKQEVQITAPRMRVAEFVITGTSPYVQQAWSKKAIQQIKETQLAGQQAKSKKNREPKDFIKCYEESIHRSTEGWAGFPAWVPQNQRHRFLRIARNTPRHCGRR